MLGGGLLKVILIKVKKHYSTNTSLAHQKVSVVVCAACVIMEGETMTEFLEVDKARHCFVVIIVINIM